MNEQDVQVQVRAGNAQDGTAVALVYGAAKATMEYLPRLHTEAEQVSYFEAQLTEHPSVLVEVGGAIIAFAIYGPGWLHHLYVHPAAQGQSIGTSLFGQVCQALPAGFELWTFQPNGGARRFYERHGCRVAEMSDGERNEEKVPDIRYRWSGQETQP